jgi:hypothetical protein
LDRHDPCNILAHLAKPAGILQLTGRVLKAQVEELLARLLKADRKFLVGEFN